MDFKGRDFISLYDYSVNELKYILEKAYWVEKSFSQNEDLRVLEGKVLASLFFEPSTRTRMSFESAMIKLGGGVISLAGPEASSVAKGETLLDTIRTVENYSDIIVLRHPTMGAARAAAEVSSIPVINAGDGSGEHPTQTLLDLYTIWREKNKLTGLNVALLGDLKYGRTVHSLGFALARFGNNLFLISPPGLEMPVEVVEDIRAEGVSVVEVSNIDEVIDELDVLYVTRIQKERFPDPKEYLKVRGSYRVTRKLLMKGKEDLIVMHPLPRVGEIDHEVDMLPQAVYFKQVKYGLYVRMALLGLILGGFK